MPRASFDACRIPVMGFVSTIVVGPDAGPVRVHVFGDSSR